MKFWNRFTIVDTLTMVIGDKGLALQTATRLAIAADNELRENVGKAELTCEQIWNVERRPYYNVYPTIIPMLTRISLDFPSDHWKLPKSCGFTLLVRLPESVKTAEFPTLRSALVASCEVSEGRQFKIYVDTGEHRTYYDTGKPIEFPIHTYLSTIAQKGKSVQEVIDMASSHAELEDNAFAKGELGAMMRLICTLCLLDDDPRLINPDVLAKDEISFLEAIKAKDEERLKAMKDRAFRRRGPGFEIGRWYENVPGSPYAVPAHPQRYHVGRGRTQTIVKVRSGYIVGEKKVREVPMGHLSSEE